MRVLFQDYVILLITGAALGLLTPTDDSKLGGPTAYTNTIIAVCEWRNQPVQSFP